VYETLNMASLWGAPILFVVENNHIAQTTPIEQALAGSILARFQAFNIPAWELQSSDVEEIASIAAPLLEEVREEVAPRALILHTCRFGPHSKGDDTRPAEQVERMRQERDPLTIQARRLETVERLAIESRVEAEIQQAFELAMTDPYPSP
jgi:TPP-dependent pyruvate/acetoin dehydrogenase alpha subunit